METKFVTRIMIQIIRDLDFLLHICSYELGQENPILVWRYQQILSGILANDLLLRISHQSCLSTQDKGNGLKPVQDHLNFRLRKNLENPS